MNIKDLSPEDAARYLESVNRVNGGTTTAKVIDTSDHAPPQDSVSPRSGCVDLGIKNIVSRKLAINVRKV